MREGPACVEQNVDAFACLYMLFVMFREVNHFFLPNIYTRKLYHCIKGSMYFFGAFRTASRRQSKFIIFEGQTFLLPTSQPLSCQHQHYLDIYVYIKNMNLPTLRIYFNIVILSLNAGLLIVTKCFYTVVLLRLLCKNIWILLPLVFSLCLCVRQKQNITPARLNILSFRFNQTTCVCLRLQLCVIAISVWACESIERHETRSDTSLRNSSVLTQLPPTLPAQLALPAASVQAWASLNQNRAHWLKTRKIAPF